MNRSIPTADHDRYVIVDDSDDDVSEILIVACGRSAFRLPDWALELEGGAP